MDRKHFMFNGGGANNGTLTMNERDVYGAAAGSTTAGQASAATADTSYVVPTAARSATAPAAPAPGGLLGQPLTWWGLVLALLVGTMMVAQQLGEQDEFSNIKMTTYNVIISGMSAIVFIVFAKMVFGRVKVPGLSQLVLSV